MENEGNSCVGLNVDMTTFQQKKDLTLNDCKNVAISDEKYKCCLITSTFEKTNNSNCLPFVKDKILDFLKLVDAKAKTQEVDENEGAFQKAVVDCGDFKVEYTEVDKSTSKEGDKSSSEEDVKSSSEDDDSSSSSLNNIEDDSDSASNYLSKALIFLLYILL